MLIVTDYRPAFLRMLFNVNRGVLVRAVFFFLGVIISCCIFYFLCFSFLRYLGFV